MCAYQSLLLHKGVALNWTCCPLQCNTDRLQSANCGHTQRTATDRDKRLMRPFMTTKARRVQHAPTDETVSRKGWVTRYLATHLKSADFSHVTHTFTRRETDVRGSRESSLKVRLYGQFFFEPRAESRFTGLCVVGCFRGAASNRAFTLVTTLR